MTTQPKISVITVVFNGEAQIAETIESIINQDYTNIEYIVIDGKSTDGTLAIVEGYRNKINTLICEPDKNLYDAMNKGLRLATGDYVWFIHCGDLIYNKTTISDFINTLPYADIYYGEADYINEEGKSIGLRSDISTHKLPDQLHWKHMKRGMIVHHQSFIVKRSIAPEYNLRYKWSADIDWVIKCLKRSTITANTHLILSKYRANTVWKKFYAGGASTKNVKASLKERFFIFNNHFGLLANLVNHTVILVRGLRTLLFK